MRWWNPAVVSPSASLRTGSSTRGWPLHSSAGEEPGPRSLRNAPWGVWGGTPQSHRPGGRVGQTVMGTATPQR